MPRYQVAVVVALGLIVVVSIACWYQAGEIVYCEKMTSDFGMAQDGSVSLEPDEVLGCALGDYLIYIPTSDSKRQQSLMVLTRDMEPQPIFFFAGRGHSIWEDGRPVVSLDDRDEDGKFDSLSYSIYYEGFRDMLEVIDSDLDGQADFKFTTGPDKRYWKWYEARWHEVRIFTAPEPQQILIDGKWIPYDVVDGKLVLLEH